MNPDRNKQQLSRLFYEATPVIPTISSLPNNRDILVQNISLKRSMAVEMLESVPDLQKMSKREEKYELERRASGLRGAEEALRRAAIQKGLTLKYHAYQRDLNAMHGDAPPIVAQRYQQGLQAYGDTMHASTVMNRYVLDQPAVNIEQ
jgi:hypothetical protein